MSRSSRQPRSREGHRRHPVVLVCAPLLGPGDPPSGSSWPRSSPATDPVPQSAAGAVDHHGHPGQLLGDPARRDWRSVRATSAMSRTCGRSARMSWNRSFRDEPYRPGEQKSDPVERLFVITAVLGFIAFEIWFLFFAGIAPSVAADCSDRPGRPRQPAHRAADAQAEAGRRRGTGCWRRPSRSFCVAAWRDRASKTSQPRPASPGAFYSNFESKDQLFIELLHDRVYRGYRRMFDRVEESGGTPARAARSAAPSASGRPGSRRGRDGCSGSGWNA